MNKLFGFVEAVMFFITIYFAFMWYKMPGGHYDALFGLTTTFFIGFEIVRRYFGHRLKIQQTELTPEQLAKHNETFRKMFCHVTLNIKAQGLRPDIIIHDIDRMDEYPNINEKNKGISSWFRAGLADLYTNGIMVILSYGSLAIGPDGYRFRKIHEQETGDIQVYLIGKIPYKNIVSVNFDGDEYYNFPHVFCKFTLKGEPYEELVFCEKIETGDIKYYKEVAKYSEVAENSKSWGGEYFA